MKPFLDKDFLLESDCARELYHGHAAKLPIIDYHCHLSPQQIAEDHRFKTITELWLGGDHYKWRAMRANGVDEKYITGEAPDWEKFEKWAETLPYTMRNPLYHWTHLELRTAFGINGILNPETAKAIYDECNRRLQEPEFSARGLMKHYNVEVVCTTDDPVDDLHWHKQLQDEGFLKVLPSWRPDKAMAVENPQAYRQYLSRLGAASGMEIDSLESLFAALRIRQQHFADHGCCVADHGVSEFPWAECGADEAEKLFAAVLNGTEPSAVEVKKLQTYILLELARMNKARQWVQQFHFGPRRNVNTRMFKSIGPDTGFDTIGAWNCTHSIIHFLDRLDSEGCLTKTILYNINPADNDVTAAMAANFQDGSCPGKVQFGAAWWFNDQLDGMERQMNALSLQGLLSRFVGMLTDSRSFLSYPRHEYFRRLLCNMIGSDVEKGLLPASEMERISAMVEDICYYNAKNYFGF